MRFVCTTFFGTQCNCFAFMIVHRSPTGYMHYSVCYDVFVTFSVLLI